MRGVVVHDGGPYPLSERVIAQYSPACRSRQASGHEGEVAYRESRLNVILRRGTWAFEPGGNAEQTSRGWSAPDGGRVMALVGRRAWPSMGGGGAAAAAAGAPALAGVRVRAAPAAGGLVAADPRIKHIVVLMLENRSCDHMLGFLMRDI